MTIDSSGNLLVGKAAIDNTTAGHRLDGSGFMSHVRDGNTVALYNRLTSDGEIINIRKDGTTIGSIGAFGGSLMVGGGDVGIGFYQGADALVPANNVTATRDAAIDLGMSSARFKDLYLSGNLIASGTGSQHSQIVSSGGNAKLSLISSDSHDAWINYSGATNEMSAGYDRGNSTFNFSNADNIASNIRVSIRSGGGITFNGDTAEANALNDYEEGSYIAGFATQNGSIALLGTHNTMNYTKIGRQVTITGRVVVNTVSSASGWVRFSLPFTNVGENEDEGHTILNVTTYKVNGIGTGQVFAEIGPSTSYGILLKTVDNVGWAYLDASGFGSNDIIYMNGTYLTNS